MIKRSTRRGSHFFIVLFFLIITILLHRSRYLIGLLFENGSTDTVYPSTPSSSSELEPNNTTTTQMIPKIIHQTYSSEDLPAHWRDAQQAVKAFYPDYDYMFWTGDSALLFISTYYPWFLDTYTSYPHTIQRADAVRYFLLYHYGGIYLHLVLHPIVPSIHSSNTLLFACLTCPAGISNDVLGAVPAFFSQTRDHQLEQVQSELGSKYISTFLYGIATLHLWCHHVM